MRRNREDNNDCEAKRNSQSESERVSTSPDGGIGRRVRFRCACREVCRFESCSGHKAFFTTRFKPTTCLNFIEEKPRGQQWLRSEAEQSVRTARTLLNNKIQTNNVFEFYRGETVRTTMTAKQSGTVSPSPSVFRRAQVVKLVYTLL